MANKNVEIAMVVPREVIQIARAANVTSGEIVCHRLARCGIHAGAGIVEVAETSYMMIYTPTGTGRGASPRPSLTRIRKGVHSGSVCSGNA